MLKLKIISLFFVIYLIDFKLHAQVTANFTADTTSGCGSATVQFTDLSSGNITSWAWNFGNTNTSTTKNPTAAYTIVGNYTVSLTVSDGTNSDTKTITNYINVFKIPTASFTQTPSSGCSPLEVSFTNTSTMGSAPIQQYLWDFSDGSQPSTTENPTHTYQIGGTFPPSLQVTDQNGCSDIVVFNNIVATQAPVVNFSTLNPPITCSDTLTVDFINKSQGTGLSYKWIFGDGQTSSLANPRHFYNGLGVYNVSLIAFDNNCSDTLTYTQYVRLESTTAMFSTSKSTFCLGEPVNFINESTGANLYRWDFGDGTSSTKRDPVKTYQDSGNFVVKLTISAGPICLKTIIDTFYVQQVIANFTTTPLFSCHREDTALFINTSINADSALWKIHKSSLKDADYISTSLPPDSLFYPQTFKFGDKPNYYSDTLIVYSKLGCTDTLIRDTNRTIEILRTTIFATDSGIEKTIVDTPITKSSYPIDDIFGGCAPLTVNYDYLSEGPGTITHWDWDLGIATSTQKAPPAQTYTDDTLRLVTLTITNNFGCTATDSKRVGAGFKQNPSFILEPDSVCPGELTNLIYDNSDDSLKVNYWEFNFYRLYGANKFQSILDTIHDTLTGVEIYRRGKRLISFSDTGSYIITQTIGQNGCDTTDTTNTKTLYVFGPIADPGVEITNNCLDRKKVQFEGNFIGVTRFVWDFGDSTALDSVNVNPLHIYPDFKTYYPSLTIYNDSSQCSPVSDTSIIFIDPPPFLRILPPIRNICAGDTLNLHSNASMRYEKFHWIINGDTVSRKKEYILDTVPGTYYVELFTIESLGCTFSALDTFRISILEVDFDTTLLDNCFPVDVEFKETSISNTPIINWHWEFSNGDTSIQAIDTISFDTEDPITVSLRVENEFGCVDFIQKKNFLQFELLNVDFLNGVTNICAGDTITFRNISSGLKPHFTWDFGDGTTISTDDIFVKHQYTTGGNFDVKLTAIDSSGCIRTEEKTNLVSVDGVIFPGFTADSLISDCYPFAVNFEDTTFGNIAQWEWRFGDGASSVFQNPFHNYTSVGMFDVFLKVTTLNGCSDSIKKIAYIQTNGPTADFVFDKDTICINEEVTFSITQSQDVASFFWDFGDGNGASGNPVTHTYTQKTGKVVIALIVQDATGNCTVPLEDSLFVYEVYADFSVSDDSACVPFEAQFTKQSIGDDSFRWNFGSGIYSSEVDPTFLYSQAGKYQVSLEISSTNGCNDTASKNIEIFPIPQAIVSNDTGLCAGDSVLLVGSGGLTYSWTPSSTLSSPTTANTFAIPDTTTTYQLIIANIANCMDTAEVEVIVQQAPIYKPLEDSTIFIGESINLNAYSGSGFTYKWTPNYGLSCDNCPNPIAQPLHNQTYILEIFDRFGCFYLTDTISIEVIEKYSLDVPNAFSPNNDGSNDIIYAKGWGLKELIAFKIYNRFGELVFESTDFDKGWDGTYREQLQNIETYVYTVEALTYSGKVLSKKGNISLLR